MSAEIKPRAFIILWLIGGLAVLPLTAVLAMALIPALREAMGLFIGTSAYYFWDDHFYIFVAVFGLTNGFCIGILQQVVVRHCFRVNLRRWWQFSTVGGGLAAAISMSANVLLAQSYRYGVLTSLIVLVIFLGLLASVQALVLRRYARGAWKWVAAHLIALPFVMLLNDFLSLFYGSAFQTIPLQLLLTILQLLIILPLILSTLLVMRRLLLETRRRDKVKRGAAAG